MAKTCGTVSATCGSMIQVAANLWTNGALRLDGGGYPGYCRNLEGEKERRVSSSLSISEVLADLEAQIAHLETQEAFHAQQEVFHRERRAVCASDLAKVRERYEGFKAAAAAVGEVVQSKPASARKPAEDDGEKIPVSKLIARVVQSKPEGERFSPSSLAQELNQSFPKTLRRRLDGRAISVALRRLAAAGRIRIVEEGRAFHEAVYTRK
jgi:hypothetical protein